MRVLLSFLLLFTAYTSLSQVVIFDETLRSGSIPTGWASSDVTIQTAASGYARFEDQSNAFLETPTFDASTFDEVKVVFDVAKWGSGGNGPLTIDYSLDGGSTWINQGTSTTPTGSTYQSNQITITETSSTLKIRFTQVASPSRKRLRDVEIIGEGSISSPTNDTDSKIFTPSTQIATSTIISDEVNSITTSQAVFNFQVEDLGSGDGLPTEISQISFVPGPNNTADWSQVIEGIRVNAGGTNIASTNQTEVILENEINLSFDHDQANVSNNMSVNDGATKEFIIQVYLEESNIIAGEIIQLQIEQNNSNFQTLASGSSFETTHDEDVTGNNHTINIPNRTLEFIQQPQTTLLNENMNLPVEVAFVDNNGNINNLETQNVNITSSGNLVDSPLSVSAVNGIASFSLVIHNQLDDNILLTASTDGLSDLDSAIFSIIEPVQLFISEVVDPGDEFNGRYIELFNAGMEAIDFDVNDYFIVREANGGPSIFNLKLEGTIEAKGYYIIGRETDFDDNYDFLPDLEDTSIAGTIAGNGDDSYFISTNVNDGNDGRNSIIDLYGEIGVQATSSTAWYYEDSRAIRNIPGVTNASQNWLENEWIIESANVADATPGLGENDYTFQSNTWSEEGLGNDPTGTSTSANNVYIKDGEETISGDLEVNDLVVRSGTILSINGALKVTGDILNQGKVIFLSDVNNTATLDELSSTSRVIGEFESRRFIPQSNRAFRYMSSPVNTTNAIRDNLQEGANNTQTGDANNIDPNPGFGTHITGSTSGANGFDATLTGNNSMFYFNNILGDWQSIPNTDIETLEAGKAFGIMIRGDRATSLSSNESLGNQTILRFTGEMHTHNFEVQNLAEGFNLVGNPYQSPVNLRDLMNNSSGLDKNFYYIFEPTLDNVGKNVAINILPGSAVPNNPSSNANVFLQPHQSFFVEATSSNPNLIFKEEYKTGDSPQTSVFSETEDDNAYLQVNLKRTNSNVFADGLRFNFDENYSPTDDAFDAIKFWNQSNNIASYNGESYLSFDSRPFPSEGDEYILNVGQFSDNNYQFVFNFNQIQDVQPFLIDNYTNTNTEIENDMFYEFTVDESIPETIDPSRFKIVFEEETLSAEEINFVNQVRIYPNPITDNKLNIETDLFINHNNVEINLYDLTGRKIKAVTASKNKVQSIDLHQLQANTSYIIEISTQSTNLKSKVIKR